MLLEQNPVWQETAPARPADPVLDQDIDCDVAIVGAGFTGLRAALALAEAETRVAVFDAGEVGVAMSLVMGSVLAEPVLGADPATLPIPVTSIGRMPFRNTQVLGAGIAMHFLRLRDRLELVQTTPGRTPAFSN